MRIAIIGAGISGLTAGRVLAKAGHEVVVFEKSKGFGGRLSTRYAGDDMAMKLDHGVPYLEGDSNEFNEFLLELLNADITKPWSPNMKLYQKGKFYEMHHTTPMAVAKNGMNTIGRYLSRMVDVRLGSRVGGLTYIGHDRSKKRAWMLNLESSDTYEADAVIISTPSKQAYSVLSTTIDEVSTLKIVREIDEVEYSPSFVLMVGYSEIQDLDWDVLQVQDSDISWISHENSKRELDQQCLVIQSSEEFALKHLESDKNFVEHELKDRLGEILGGWAAKPQWSQVHFWRYKEAINPLNVPYIDLNEMEKPLAVVGSYMNGNTVESAYLSGLRLAEKWLESLA